MNMNHYFSALTALLIVSCALQNDNTQPPYGVPKSGLPREIVPRIGTPEIIPKSSMLDVFLSLGFYECTESEFKDYYLNHPEGKKDFFYNEHQANLLRSPHGSVFLRRVSNQPNTRVEATLQSEEEAWIYILRYCQEKRVWKIDLIKKSTAIP